tara:strand:+ start:16396 stop:16731 length:336 start_codon:yes stop_codon:yes gene_type:complete
MPKVTYTAAKGLVQASGAGVELNSITSVAAPGNLDATTFLTIATAAIAGGGLVLPATAEDGAVKIIITTTADNVLLKGTNASTGDLTLTNIGDMAVCVYQTDKWIVGRSLT